MTNNREELRSPGKVVVLTYYIAESSELNELTEADLKYEIRDQVRHLPVKDYSGALILVDVSVVDTKEWASIYP
jgi:hypothetical protein